MQVTVELYWCFKVNKKEFLEYLYEKKRFLKKSGKEIMSEYTKYFSCPEHSMKIIHIAGTNGKGSVAAMISSILIEAGFNVGLFTSPHLIEFNERIKFNGKDIDDEELLAIGSAVKDVGDKVNSTMFDDSLMIALLYFKKKKANYVVLETGLGGRLDATTGINCVPLVSVITKIGLDHTKYLGNDVVSIAKEKAGILKKGTRLVIGENVKEVVDTIENKAKEVGVSYIYTGDFYKEKKDDKLKLLDKGEDDKLKLINKNELGDISNFIKNHIEEYIEETSLKGDYQKENIKTAILAVKTLFDIEKDKGIKELKEKYFDEYIKNGLKKVSWPGRFQIINDKPLIIIDGSHNPQAVNAFIRSMTLKYPGRDFIGVFSILKDKDRKSIYKIIKENFSYIYTVDIKNKRALDGKILAKELNENGILAEFEGTCVSAIIKAKKKIKENLKEQNRKIISTEIKEQNRNIISTEIKEQNRKITSTEMKEQSKVNDSIIICFGSLYLIGEILKNKDKLKEK